jgi:hypothetical protein
MTTTTIDCLIVFAVAVLAAVTSAAVTRAWLLWRLSRWVREAGPSWIRDDRIWSAIHVRRSVFGCRRRWMP